MTELERTRVHVVGGGVAGLVAAITAAQAGAPVVLHEAGTRLGGRGSSGIGSSGIGSSGIGSSGIDSSGIGSSGIGSGAAGGAGAGFGVNTGPHVLFADGAVLRWLRAQRIPLAVRRPASFGAAVISDGRARHLPSLGFVAPGLRHLRTEAPVDERFDTWAARVLGEANALEVARWAGLLTFHHDPGSLSARFVWDRCRRVFTRPDHVRSVIGGWSSLIDALATRARELDVSIETGAPLDALPDHGPVIVATGLPAASVLLDEEVAWHGSRTALLDVALAARTTGTRPPLAVDLSDDLRTCCFVDRVTATDPTLAPRGTDLLQAQLGIAPEVPAATAIARIEQALDVGYPGWRSAERWRRELVLADATGAVDPPGTTWRDRPAIARGDDRFLAGDKAAAPGLLSEVAVNSAVRAAHLALDARRQRTFAPGWPSAALTPTARVELVAVTMPISVVRTVERAGPVDDVWGVQPNEESEPYFQLRRGRLHTVAVGASRHAGPASATRVSVAVGTACTTTRVVSWLLERIAARELRRHRAR